VSVNFRSSAYDQTSGDISSTGRLVWKIRAWSKTEANHKGLPTDKDNKR